MHASAVGDRLSSGRWQAGGTRLAWLNGPATERATPCNTPLAELQAVELASWQALHGGGSGGRSSAGAPLPPYCRLAVDAEVEPLVAAAAELLQPKRDEDEGGQAHGRGRRGVGGKHASSASTCLPQPAACTCLLVLP